SYDIRKPGVRILTSRSSLGLEFSAVIIIWLQQFKCDAQEQETQLIERQLLYVAMTRATKFLYLFASQSNSFIKNLSQSKMLEVISY
ncbi:MAG: ATP-binding domain-containing protein, partial [Prochloraceae cyanobacterium]